MTIRVDGSEFGLTRNRFDFTCASAGITGVVCASSPASDTALDTSVKTEIPKKYQVVVLDDDYTPMAFVIDLLQRVFRLDADTAIRKTMQIHQTGQAVCGTYSYDIALAKVDQVIESARKEGHPLLAAARPN